MFDLPFNIVVTYIITGLITAYYLHRRDTR